MVSFLQDWLDRLGLTPYLIAIAAVSFFAGQWWSSPECPDTYVYIPRPAAVEQSVIKSRSVPTKEIGNE